jgi:hypothetical protein
VVTEYQLKQSICIIRTDIEDHITKRIIQEDSKDRGAVQEIITNLKEADGPLITDMVLHRIEIAIMECQVI